MLRKRCKNAAAFFVMALVFFGVLSPGRVIANAAELSLTVSYDAKCGAPSTFTVQAAGGSGNYLYYLGNITRDGEDGQYFVMDPSRLPGYKADNTFQFTFCASGVYYLHFYVMDKGASPIATKRKIVQVTLNDPAYPTIEAIADRVAAQCKASCKTEYERALWLHDWLVDHCAYDYSLLYCGSEGALARGKGTCESYHRAYTMLLNRVGIANGRMEGNGHVWTAVRMDGNWYQVDVTWDDNGYSNHTYENYLYFGLNDAIMKMVHSDHSPHSGYISNALANHYLIRSGTIRRWSDPLTDPIQQNLRAGKTSFAVPVTASLPGSNQDVVYNLVAYQLSSQKWSTATDTVQLQASYSAGQMQLQAVYTPIPSMSTPSTGTDSSPSQGGGKPSGGTPSTGTGSSPSQGGGKPSGGTPSAGTDSSSSQGNSRPSGSMPSIGMDSSSSQGSGGSSGDTPSMGIGSSSSQGSGSSSASTGSTSENVSSGDTTVPPVILPPVEEQPVVLIDEKTGIKLGAAAEVVPPDTVLVVAPSDFVPEDAVGKFAAFDILLENGGVKIQPNGKVQVSIPIPAGYDKERLTVYYIADDGAKTELPCMVAGDSVTFETDHFSLYALAEKAVVQTPVEGTVQQPGEEPKTKGDGPVVWVALGVTVAVAAGGGVVFWRFKSRKKPENDAEA